MMTKFANKFLSAILCMCVLGMLSFTLYGCGQTGNTIYSNVIKQYNEIIASNTDIFDKEGNVDIQYGDTLNTAINSNDSYVKLANNIDEKQTYGVLFAPVFEASMYSINYYIKRLDFGLVNLPANQSQKVLDALQEFESALNAFTTQKHSLEARTSFDVTSNVVQNELNKFCSLYRDLDEKSCALSSQVLDFYTNNIFEGVKFNNGRYSLGSAKLQFLSRLTQFATIDQQIFVNYYFDKTYTNHELTDTQILLNDFDSVSSYTIWEGTQGDISTLEQASIDALATEIDYNEVFASQYNLFNESMAQISLTNYYNYKSGSYNDSNYTVSERVGFAKIDEFLQTYATNMFNYERTLIGSVGAYKASI